MFEFCGRQVFACSGVLRLNQSPQRNYDRYAPLGGVGNLCGANLIMSDLLEENG
jgi:hypothetical protein